MHIDSPPRDTAVLIFADGQQRDLRRRGFAGALASLLALPRLDDIRPRADLHWFTDSPGAARRADSAPGLRVHTQRGKTFGQRLENALDDLAQAGYRRVVIVGRDCPQLGPGDVSAAIDALESGRRLVLGPDHRGGCWLIGLNLSDRSRLSGVRWQRDTDAGELLARFGAEATAIFETRVDLDRFDDLRRLAREDWGVAQLLRRLGLMPSPTDQPPLLSRAAAFVRASVQLPPPVGA